MSKEYTFIELNPKSQAHAVYKYLEGLSETRQPKDLTTILETFALLAENNLDVYNSDGELLEDNWQKPIKPKTIPTVKDLITLGTQSEQGLICKHCGRKFKKATGTPRSCSKCQKQIDDLWYGEV